MIGTLAEKRTRNYVRFVVLKHRVPSQDADDIIQESLLRAIENIDRYKPGNFEAWVAGIAINVIRNMRRRHRYTHKHVDDDVLDDVLAFTPDAGLPRELEYAMEILTDHERALIYAIADGYSYDECAEKFVLPIGTVMSRLCRARAKLRLILGR